MIYYSYMKNQYKLKGKEQEINQLYKKGLSLRKIAKQYGVSPQAIVKYVDNRTKTEAHKFRTEYKEHKPIPNLKELYAKYQNLTVMEKMLGISRQTLRFKLRKLGISIIKKLPRGKEHWNWKGGRYKKEGYVFVYKPDHPYSQKGHVREHRLVMEKILGRYLKPEESVHHRNEIKDDNRPENLMYFATEAEHQKYHNKLRGGK